VFFTFILQFFFNQKTDSSSFPFIAQIMKLKASLICLSMTLLYFMPELTECIKVSGKCGFPGRPYMSKLEPDELTYKEGEEVTYECIEYWFYLQSRKCEGGRWTGKQPRCGEYAFSYL
jgi:hypothetical protein